MSERSSPGRLAVLVHELRSPVAALVAIRDATPAASGDARELAELVRLALAACVALERIIRDTSAATVRMQEVDLATILSEAAAAAELRGGRVRRSAASDLPRVTADPVRIRQALDNLVANALAQTPDGEVVLDARADGDTVVVAVTDSGPGIPESEQERIFEPGVRLGSRYPGSGLGLAVVQSIAEAHGGRVTVRSAPGEGATFSLVLPLGRP